MALNDLDLDLLPGITVNMTKIRAGELRKKANENPDHPVSKIFIKAVEGFEDKRIVSVESLDLEAIEKNLDITFEEHVVQVEGGQAIDRRKVLIPYAGTTTASKTSTSASPPKPKT